MEDGQQMQETDTGSLRKGEKSDSCQKACSRIDYEPFGDSPPL